ncbi:MAG: hypothetical protein GY820_18760 [Gammaproteobacteria bacterium]|nr:hypothetical protein [Gammaproteobacteria bacterium]
MHRHSYVHGRLRSTSFAIGQSQFEQGGAGGGRKVPSKHYADKFYCSVQD